MPSLSLVDRPQPRGAGAQALRPLLKKRVALKHRQAELPAWDARRRTDKQRASALKWLLVTCFGYLGYRNARFGRIEAHQAVTAYGREALLRAKEAAEDLGYRSAADVRGRAVGAEGGQGRPEDFQPLLEEIGRRSGLPIALDGIYRWVVFLPSRVNPTPLGRQPLLWRLPERRDQGARDRRPPPRHPGLDRRGADGAARDPGPRRRARRCPAAGHRLAAPPPGGAARRARARRTELLLAQRLTREVEDYRSPSPGARAARQLKEVGKIVKPGQRVRFLYTLGRPGVYAWDLPRRQTRPRWISRAIKNCSCAPQRKCWARLV